MQFPDCTGLDTQTLALMSAACDDACKVLEITGRDPRMRPLVEAIVTAARAAERDAKKLRECGVSACSDSGRT
jgi:hypothetical protein